MNKSFVGILTLSAAMYFTLMVPSQAKAISFATLPKALQPSVPSVADPALFEQLCSKGDQTKAASGASQTNFNCKSGTYQGLNVPNSRAVQACAAVLQSQATKTPLAPDSKIFNNKSGYYIGVVKPLSNPPVYNPIQIFNCQPQ